MEDILLYKHIKTIYKGCEESAIRTDPAKSYVIRFTMHEANSHATLMSMLSPAFLHAQQNADERISTDPFHITILWHKSGSKKRKPANKETALEVLLYFIENMRDPKHGAIVSIYEGIKTNWFSGEQWRHSQVWPFKQQWTPKDEYITVHKAELNMSKSRMNKTIKQQERYLPIVLDRAQRYGLDVKYIDYTMYTDEIINTLVGTNFHFTYSGATMYTAAMLGVPTLAWHEKDKVESKMREWRDHTSTIRKGLVQKGPWGAMCTHDGKIKQYSIENSRVETHPLYFNSLIIDEEDIESAFHSTISGAINDKNYN